MVKRLFSAASLSSARNFHIALLLILLFAFVTRAWRVAYPPEYVFDEVYHALTAKLISRNDPRAYEWWHAPVEPHTAIEWTHPPMAKLFQAAGIQVFGENARGWRASSVLFGVLSIWLIARVAKEVTGSSRVALVSAVLFSFDGLNLVLSRIAMNDIHLVSFVLLTIWMYWKYRQQMFAEKMGVVYLLATAVSFGLTIATKWSGVILLGVMLVDQIYVRLSLREIALRQAGQAVLAFLIIVPLVYLGSYSQMFLQGKSLQHFKDLTYQMWWYHTNLEATHAYQSTPVQWVLNLRPVWFYVTYSGTLPAHIYAQGNPLLMWFGLVVAISFVLKMLVHKKILLIQEKHKTLQVQLTLKGWQEHQYFLLLCYVVLWVPYLLSPRIMFFYHYMLAVPFLCILTALFLERLWKGEKSYLILGGVILASIVVCFFAFYPNWTAIGVAPAYRKTVYELLPSWK